MRTNCVSAFCVHIMKPAQVSCLILLHSLLGGSDRTAGNCETDRLRERGEDSKEGQDRESETLVVWGAVGGGQICFLL